MYNIWYRGYIDSIERKLKSKTANDSLTYSTMRNVCASLEYIYIYIYIYIYNIALLAWISLTLSLSIYIYIYLTIFLYHPSLLAGLLDYIMCPYRAIVNKFLFVSQPLHVRVKSSIEKKVTVISLSFSPFISIKTSIFAQAIFFTIFKSWWRFIKTEKF